MVKKRLTKDRTCSVRPLVRVSGISSTGSIFPITSIRVFRMIAIYVVGAWLVLQVADVLFPGWGIAEEAIRFVVYAAAVGFPVALVFAWRYDITPTGIQRTSPANDDSDVLMTGRDIGLLVVLSALFIAIAWSFALRVADMRGTGSAAPAAAAGDRSLAILPFQDDSMEPGGAAFLANGVHRDLMTNVMRIEAIEVIAQTSVEPYRDTVTRSRDIGRELAVAHLLTGTVQKAGSRVRISVQLVDASSERSLWGEAYDRTLTPDNLFDIQADIARRVAASLQAELSPQVEQRNEAAPTQVFEAYEAVARRTTAFIESDSEDIDEAERYFRQALKLQPDFALAHAMLGRVQLMAHQFGGLDRETAYREAESSLRRAIELDPTIALAHAWLAVVVRDRDADFEQADALLGRALQLEPGNSRAMHIRGLTLRLQGNPQAAVEWYERAMRLDPLSLIVNESYGSVLRDLGRFDEARAQYRKTIEMNPDFPHAYWGMGSLLWSAGDVTGAFEWFNEVIERAPASDAFRAWLALLYLDLAMTDAAAAHIDQSVATLGDAETHDLQFVRRLVLIQIGEDPAAIPDTWGKESHVWFGNIMRIARQSLLSGRYDEALLDYGATYPELLEADGPLNALNARAAVDMAHAFRESGDAGRALALLDRADDFNARQNRLGFRGSWIEDVRTAAIRGQQESALDALEAAVSEGWRNLWWFYLYHDPTLAPLRDHPRFLAIVDQLESERARQVAELNP